MSDSRRVTGKRVLGRIRLSHFTEESTSVERQREIIETWAKTNGHVVVAWAEDIDVSRSIDPFEAPELKPWLTDPERLEEWDIVATWKLDRIATGSIYLNALMGWCQKTGKALVSVTESFDLSTWVGRMVASVIAGVAEGELEAIKERTGGSQKKIRSKGAWHGGTVPYGYRAVKGEDSHWYWVIDNDCSEIVREIVSRVLDEQSVRSIADDLNTRGIHGPRGGTWTAQTITRMLRSRWVVGQAEHNGKAVVGENGLPWQKADPIITHLQWREVQAMLDDRKRPKQRKNGTGLLLNVAYCLECKEPLWLHVMTKPERNQSYRYWRCSGRVKKKNGCSATSIEASSLEAALEDHFLQEGGDDERTERIYVPGEDHSEELSQVEHALDTARKEYDLGLYDDDEEMYLSRVQTLAGRRKALKALPARKGGWTLRGLGETYRQAWERMDTDERRKSFASPALPPGPKLSRSSSSCSYLRT